jgi:hypothetical protein
MQMDETNDDPVLSGKTALVTGGARRIGREICLSLARRGVNVVVHYQTSVLQAKNLCSEIRDLGVNAWSIAADFKKAESAETIVEKTLQRAGRLDMIVNNASVYTKSTLSGVIWPDLSLNMQVNAWAPLIIGREFKRLVGRGSIVNLLDSRICGGDPTHLGYIVSKRTLADLTAMMALEFAPKIAVNAVAPGLVLSPAGAGPAALKKLSANLPLERHGSPRDVAQAVVFLLQSSFITGQVIYVDGGRNIRESMPR